MKIENVTGNGSNAVGNRVNSGTNESTLALRTNQRVKANATKKFLSKLTEETRERQAVRIALQYHDLLPPALRTYVFDLMSKLLGFGELNPHGLTSLFTPSGLPTVLKSAVTAQIAAAKIAMKDARIGALGGNLLGYLTGDPALKGALKTAGSVAYSATAWSLVISNILILLQIYFKLPANTFKTFIKLFRRKGEAEFKEYFLAMLTVVFILVSFILAHIRNVLYTKTQKSAVNLSLVEGEIYMINSIMFLAIQANGYFTVWMNKKSKKKQIKKNSLAITNGNKSSPRTRSPKSRSRTRSNSGTK